MNFSLKLLLLIFTLAVSVLKAQETSKTVTKESEFECILTRPEEVEVKVFVKSSREGLLKDLVYQKFEVYDEKEKMQITSFLFNKLENQYIIKFLPTTFIVGDSKWHNIKVRLNLSGDEKKKYGKIYVTGKNGYYPSQY